MRELAVGPFPAVVVAMAMVLPYLNKAYGIDDPTFLFEARHLLRDPLHPTAFYMVFEGVRLRVSEHLVSGPVMALLLVPAILAGGAEWVAHLMQAVVLAAGVWATAALALRLNLDRTRAMISSLLLVASPAVTAMATTALPDIEAMTFATAGVERLLAWRKSRRLTTALTSGALLALAVLSRPHALLILVCAAIWLWDTDGSAGFARRVLALSKRVLISPLFITVAVLALVVVATRDPIAGSDLASTTIDRVLSEPFLWNAANLPIQWTLSFPLGFLWPLLDPRGFFCSKFTYLFFAAGLVLAAGGDITHADAISVAATAVAGLGGAVLGDVFVDAWRRRDRTQLALGLWLVIPVATAFYVHFPAKYLVPSAPAMAVLLGRRVRLDDRRAAHTAILAFTTAAGLLLGQLIIRADAAFCEVGRQGGAVVAQAAGAGERVWMDGGWGFQWYAMEAGARPLTITPPYPEWGDVVVVGFQGRLVRRFFRRKTLLYVRVFDEPGGRTMNRKARAGFFSNTWGPLPWVWSSLELGRIEAWRIGP